MANKEHLRQIRLGVGAWNRWRSNRVVKVDLSDVQLQRMNLSLASLWNVDFSHADLAEANLSQSILGRSDFFYTNLSGANLRLADLGGRSEEHTSELQSRFG